MGCCFSTGAALLADTDSKHVVVEMASVDSDAHAAIPFLAALDDRLVAALRSGTIKLLLADFLRGDGSAAALPHILRRQDLEALERSAGARIFLSPCEAVEALRSEFGARARAMFEEAS